MNVVRELIFDDAGASLAEYAVLLGAVGVATVGAIGALRDQFAALVTSTASTLGATSK